MNLERRRLLNALFIPAVLAVAMLLVQAAQWWLSVDLHFLGIYPRQYYGLPGLLTMPFVHGDWSHFGQNILPFLLLSTTLFYFYKGIALKTFSLLWFGGNLLLWIIGRESYHLGASGMIYALATFLCFSGLFRRYIPLIAISLIIVFIYGGLVWYMFPWESMPTVSWEGHLAGGVVGLAVAIVYRHQGPQARKPSFDDDPDDSDPYWLLSENESEQPEMKKTEIIE